MSLFTPRLTSNGIYKNKKWYSENPFELSGYGLPNCTCYAWGRFWEVSGIKPDALSLGDGGDWFPDAISKGVYKTGSVPELGSIACYGKKGGAGHVCVVEEIRNDGTWLSSNSGYNRPIAPYPPDTRSYFFTSENGIDNMASWMSSDYFFQGFIYSPGFVPPEPPIFPFNYQYFLLMCKKRKGLL